MAAANRKPAVKPRTASGAGAVNRLRHIPALDWQLRITALETATRVLGGGTSSPQIVTDAARNFYDFLIGK